MGNHPRTRMNRIQVRRALARNGNTIAVARQPGAGSFASSPRQPSPALRTPAVADRLRELAREEILIGQPVPPMPPGAFVRLTAQVTGSDAWARVYRSNGHHLSGTLKRQPQVAVIGDHDRSVHSPIQHVHEQVRGNVHVRSLFLEVLVRNYKPGVADETTAAVLHLNRPVRQSNHRLAPTVGCSQKPSPHPGNELSLLKMVDGAMGAQNLRTGCEAQGGLEEVAF